MASGLEGSARVSPLSVSTKLISGLGRVERLSIFEAWYSRLPPG